MESHSAPEGKALLIYAITWLKLQCVIVGGRSQTQKAINYMIAFWKSKPIGNESIPVVARG